MVHGQDEDARHAADTSQLGYNKQKYVQVEGVNDSSFLVNALDG